MALVRLSELLAQPDDTYAIGAFNVSDMDRDLRILIEPAAVIVHAVEQAKQIFNFKFNSYVLVQGCGPIGLLLLTMVRCLGVRNIIACDGDAKRL